MYVITGATGNTGSRIARTLLDRGKQVRVLARGANGLRPLTERGAEPCLCDLTDSAALTRAFEGAEAVYAMIPPSLSSPDYLSDQRRVIDVCVNALGIARVPYLEAARRASEFKPVMRLRRSSNSCRPTMGPVPLGLSAPMLLSSHARYRRRRRRRTAASRLPRPLNPRTARPARVHL